MRSETVHGATSRSTRRELTKEAFDRLLVWLDQDRDQAAERYEQIRIRLIKMFENRGCANPEDLVDETIDRVARKVHQVAGTYEGNPVLYFHGVARLVHLEHLRKHPHTLPVPQIDTTEEIEQRYDCLESCLNRLTPGNRELILHYYQNDSETSMDVRRAIAGRLGISPNAVRIRTHRIREGLSRCINDCLALKGAVLK
ncbi:MAG TPA: sigma-70 family RNA polymerase sigma factor [Blastocatellia bacterium]|nr:sigma-70 family RNA polymerase sigma factor [Blastocatellia bacterium]